jgi:hypothetical protein
MTESETGFLPDSDLKRFDFFFLSALYGLLCFKLLFVFFPSEEAAQRAHFFIYFLGWAVCFPAGIVLICGLERVRRKFFYTYRFFYASFLLLNTGLLLFLLHPSQWDIFGRPLPVVYFLVAQSFGLLLAKIVEKILKETWNVREWVYVGIAVLIFMWVLTLTSPLDFVKNWKWENIGFFGCVLYLFHFGLRTGSGDKEKEIENFSIFVKLGKILEYMMIFLLIAYLVIDTRFLYNPHHSSYYLGPLADLKTGKSLLVNINAQYGILVFYFLGAIFHFLPLGYVSLCLTDMALRVLQFFIFYWISKQLLKSVLLSLFSLGALLLLNHFAESELTSFFPSTGPLRFGFAYLLVALVLLRNQHPAWKKIFFVLEAIVAATAFGWSLEVSFYTVPAYLALILFEAFQRQDGRLYFNHKDMAERVAFFLAGVGFWVIYFYIDVYRRTQDFPHWSYYLDYLSLYQEGFGAVPFKGLGYWWIIIGVIILSLTTLLAMVFDTVSVNAPPHVNAVFFLTIYGIFQFLYFVGRSHPNNLVHICMPSLLLSIYWLTFIRRTTSPALPRALRGWVFSLLVIFVGIYLQVTFPTAISKIRDQSFSIPRFLKYLGGATRDLPRDERFARLAAFLMEKYSGDQKSLVYFFGEKGLEVSLYAGRSKIYPYNDVSQAAICPAVVGRLLKFDPLLKPGDFIYFSRDMIKLRDQDFALEPTLFNLILQKYDLEMVESRDGIGVGRLRAKKPDKTG